MPGTYEMTAVPKLLSRIDLKGCAVSLRRDGLPEGELHCHPPSGG